MTKLLKLPIYNDSLQDYPEPPEGWHGAARRITLSRVIPSQPTVQAGRVEHYQSRKRRTDDNCNIPFGLRFKGDPHVYLLDGNTRYMAALKRGVKTMRIEVRDMPITYAQALEQMVKAYREKLSQVLERQQAILQLVRETCQIISKTGTEEIEQQAA